MNCRSLVVSWWQCVRAVAVGVFALSFALAEDTTTASVDLEFASAESLCHYHCSASHFRPDLSQCDSSVCSLRRLQQRSLAQHQPIQSVNLLTCRQTEGDAKISVGFELPNAHLLTSTSAPKLFANFTRQLLDAYDAIVTGADARFDACQLQFLQQALDQVAPPSDSQQTAHSQALPTLFKLNSTSDQRSCVQQIRESSNQSFTPFISRSDSSSASSTIILAHVSASVAQQINEFDCIESVTELPAILKLMPFARSVERLSNDETMETPAMEIALIRDSDRSTVWQTLSDQFKSLSGITNAFQLPSSDGRIDGRPNMLYLRSFHELETWTRAVSLVIATDQVEWVDRRMELSRSALLRKSTMTRRLDEYVGDVVGINDAQKHGINGNNVVVGITDSGLYVKHDQFDQVSGVAYGSGDVRPDARKVVLYNDWGDRFDQSDSGECGHGTHVSGILAGSSNSGKGDMGIAPKAKIAFMDIGTQDRNCIGESGCPVHLSITPEASSLLKSQIKAGARIFSFSWGANESDYSGLARDLDQFLYENPEVLVVVAAGNTPKVSDDTGATGTIASPAGAKNVITVGASLNAAASFGGDSPFHNCPEVFNEFSVADFSSAGPTSDGRLKPDIVAPGMTLISAKSLKPGSTATTSDTCSLQGTSQATPVVAGMAVLLYEWLRDGWWKDGVKDDRYAMEYIPSALLKALIIHSSEGLRRRLPIMPKDGAASCGYVAGKTLPLQYPDVYQGYGKPNMSNLAEFASASGIGGGSSLFFLPNNTNGSQPIVKHGKKIVIRFTVPRDVDLRATLVWTDPAGASRSATTLQNDLDLVIRLSNPDANGVKEFAPLTASSKTDGRDTVNNVEMVQVAYKDLLAAANQLNPSLVGPTGDIVVEASVIGRSVLQSDNQSFAFVASSSSVGDSTTGNKSVDGSVWSTGVLIGVIAGALVLLLLVACAFRFCKGASTGGSVYRQEQYGTTPETSGGDETNNVVERVSIKDGAVRRL